MVRRGLDVVAMKPIETGVAFGDPSRDGVRLAKAAGHEHLLGTTAPIVLRDPVAPLVAARRTNTLLNLDVLNGAVRVASVGRDALIVEGAGGLLVPVTDEETYATLFRGWSLGVIVVAANKLGVINHVRLTCAACRTMELAVHAIVLNQAAPVDASDASTADNASVIAELEDIPVVTLPWLKDPHDVDHAAAAIASAGLLDLLMTTAEHSTTIV
jgi:dethiobiotin synthetase